MRKRLLIHLLRHGAKPCILALIAFIASAPLIAAGNDPPAEAAEEKPLTDEQVLDALKKGADFLLKSQDEKTGTWERVYNAEHRYTGGETSLILYALLNVGQGINDPRLKPHAPELQAANKFLTTLKPKTTYVASMQVSALTSLPPKPEYTNAIQRSLKLLIDGQYKCGGHNYNVGQNFNRDPERMLDASNTQYGLLGTWAAFNVGGAVPAGYWKNAERYWRDNAAPDGGWAYRPKGAATLSMTAAGVSSLLISTEQTDRILRLESRPDKDLERGIAFLSKNFDPKLCDSYTLYSVERSGLLSGEKYFGHRNWFESGANLLVQTQAKDGSWTRPIVGLSDTRVDTAFCLLFLARGRNPVAFNKLQYEGNWQARPRDVANLSEHISRQLERPFNWQVVNLTVDPDQWQDAPALLLTGTKDPNFTPEQLNSLREYLGGGGMIFSVALGESVDSAEFTAAMQKYASQMLQNHAQMRDLPSDHPLFSIFGKIANPPKLLGLTNGIRELWLHSPADLGAAWQLKDQEKKEAFELPTNIYVYACGKEDLRSKLRTTAVNLGRQQPVRSITMGRLQWDGNWNPEFGAWDRLARLAAAHFRTQLQTVTMTPEKLDLNKARFTWLTGTGRISLTDDQLAKVRAYLDGGGALIVDAAGGNAEFADSFQALCKQLYPHDELKLLSDRHSIYAGTVDDGLPASIIKYRPLTEAVIGKTTTPRMFALSLPRAAGGTRVAIVFSPFDITCGLAGVRAWGVDGYTIDSAELLSRDLLLFFAATTRPQPKP